jgi:hypothetical protein
MAQIRFVRRNKQAGGEILHRRRLHARRACAEKQKLCAPKQAASGHVAYKERKRPTK